MIVTAERTAVEKGACATSAQAGLPLGMSHRSCNVRVVVNGR